MRSGNMIKDLFDSLASFDPRFAVFIVSMLPGIELRGGIPLGFALGMNWFEVCGWSLLGNLVPIPFVIIFGRYCVNWLAKFERFSGFIGRSKTKIMSKSNIINKYGPWGLFLFVGVPIIGTGVWNGSILSLIMNLRMKKAIPAMVLGMLMACVIMTIGSFGVAGLFDMVN